MTLGLSLPAFTLLHTIVSLIELVAGLAVGVELWNGRRTGYWTRLFFLSALLTAATGFLFPVSEFKPSHAVGILSLLLLALAWVAASRAGGGWRRTYVVAVWIVFYLDAFVGVIQAFLKIPALRALAPHGNEPPFQLAHALLFAAFVVSGFLLVRRTR